MRAESPRLRATASLLIAAALLTGCGDEQPAATGVRAPRPPSSAPAEARDGESGRSEASVLEPARCPAGSENCEEASGTVLYVERVDPDGDGDAHFVLAGSAAITGPGISVIDVSADLRPDPLPGPGDALSAAGPVYVGSYGQRQIQADVVNVARG